MVFKETASALLPRKGSEQVAGTLERELPQLGFVNLRHSFGSVPIWRLPPSTEQFVPMVSSEMLVKHFVLDTFLHGYPPRGELWSVTEPRQHIKSPRGSCWDIVARAFAVSFRRRRDREKLICQP